MRYTSILLTMALLAVSVSCKLEEGSAGKNAAGTDVFEALLEPASDAGTRVTLKDKVTPIWTSGDVITIVGTSLTDFTLTSGAGTASGKFTGSRSEAGTGPYWAIFPKSDDAALSHGELIFSIAKEKGASTGNIKSNVLPMVAEADGSSLNFHNLFSLLKITLTSVDSVKIRKMTLHDLGGNQLWGTCSVPIHSDTLAYSEMALTGGDNSTSIVWSTNVTLGPLEAKSFYFCVPPGSLDCGFSIVLYEYDSTVGDKVGRAYTFLQKVSSPVAGKRSVIINIDPAQISEKSEPLEVKARGYYKTLFVNGGKGLNHFVLQDTLPWVKACGLENDYEYVSCSNDSQRDTISNFGILVQAPATAYSDVTWSDENGVLLYPDGEPRFRAVYVNGGSSKKHGRYLTQSGRDHFHDFYYNGGSYLASCAGTFLASTYVDGDNCYNGAEEDRFTFGIWPNNLNHTKMPVNISTYGSIYTMIKNTSTLGSFSPGDTIEHVRHHGGSYLPSTSSIAALNPERLFSYQYVVKNPEPDTMYTINHISNEYFGKIRTKKDSTCIWAYKNAEITGRAVLCGSHPECNTSQSQVNLMKDMLEYALEGSGNATVKAPLELGVTREMNASWSAGTPAYAKIGDRQYHHFKLQAPTDLEDFTLTLDSEYNASSGIDLYLSLRRGDLAWISDSDYILCNKGGQKTFKIKSLPAGTWYIGVYCATTVTATPADGSSIKHTHFFKYSGKTVTQNGIAYSLTTSAVGYTAASLPDYSGQQISFTSDALDD